MVAIHFNPQSTDEYTCLCAKLTSIDFHPLGTFATCSAIARRALVGISGVDVCSTLTVSSP